MVAPEPGSLVVSGTTSPAREADNGDRVGIRTIVAPGGDLQKPNLFGRR